MYSVSYLLKLAASLIGVWMMVFSGTGLSNPLSHQLEQCGGSGSSCAIRSESYLEEQFLEDNSALYKLYAQRLIIGSETAYAASFTNIVFDNPCVEELVMDYDSERFPPYLINSTCKDDCLAIPDRFLVRKLNTAACEGGWQNYELQPPISLTVCKESS